MVTMFEKEQESRSGLSEMREKIWRKRYALDLKETFGEGATRSAHFMARAENSMEQRDDWAREFEMAISNLDFIPAGRILRNADRGKPQMLNCFVLGVRDNREDIGDLARKVFIVSASGGGVGINFSELRPEGDDLVSNGGRASGPCSFMKMIDDIGSAVESGGQRRAALIFILGVDHPDIMKFIHLKETEGHINNANISVGLTTDFIEAVRHDSDWELVWGGNVYETVKARDLWQELIHANYNFGDPGIFNISLANEYSNIYYYDEITAPNPCGEIPMAENDCCCLGSVNLATHVTPPQVVDGDVVTWGKVDWDKLERTVKMGVRFLDNVLAMNDYPLNEIKQTCEENRRIGLGVMGLHYMMLDLGIKYGANDQCLKFMDRLFRFIKEHAYEASADLAKEKGPFPKFKKQLVMKSKFIQSLPEWLQDKIHTQGLRNCAVLMVAPTGTTAQLAQVSTGVEPIFDLAYIRKARLGDGEDETQDFYVVDPKFEEYTSHGLPLDNFVTAHDLDLRDHLLVQAAIQKHVDNAISKTCNIPNDYPLDTMSDDMLHFADRIKGSTMWRDGSRNLEILKPCTVDEAMAALGTNTAAAEVPVAECDNHCEI